jgi:hypothetical protein
MLDNQNKIMDKERDLTCSSCGEQVSQESLDKGLYMNIVGGKIIHWNCEDATTED